MSSLPHFSSAKYGPECSKLLASSIMPNSLVPVCVSTGIRPVSCRITMNSAAAASRWAGRMICPALDRTVAASA